MPCMTLRSHVETRYHTNSISPIISLTDEPEEGFYLDVQVKFGIYTYIYINISVCVYIEFNYPTFHTLYRSHNHVRVTSVCMSKHKYIRF